MSNSSNFKLKRNLTALVEFSSIINSSIDLDFILNNVMLTCLGKFLATRGLIALSENGKIVLKHSKGVSESVLTLFPDLNANPDCTSKDELKAFMNKANLKAIQKISSSDDCVGIVCLGEKLNKSDYTNDDLEFLGTILNISATAIQNSVVFGELKKVNRILDSRLHRLSSLFELSKEFGMFSESTKVAKLLIFSVIGQFLVSKYAVVTFNETGIDVLECKFGKDELIKNLNEYDLTFSDNSIGKERLEKEYTKIYDLGVELIVSMEIQGKTKGLILLGKSVNNQPYNETDIEFIFSVGSLAIISLENKRLFLEELEKRKLEEELDLARDIQRNLLPLNIPKFDDFDIAALNISSKQVGGDYYDVIPLDEDNFCIAIADVSGKGVPASLMMANIQAFLQVICKQGMKIDEATGLINDLISGNTTDGRFITFFWGIVNIKKNTFTYVNAGHNPPLLIRDGNIDKLEKGGMILGVMKTDIPYIAEEVKLKKEDVIIMFTDGVSEAMNKNREEFSDERLESVALTLKDEPAEVIMDGIKTEVQNFASGVTQSDDITMLVIKVR
jgi:sigma-B regulation protein RsbU (phosphoserine phosphatase)